MGSGEHRLWGGDPLDHTSRRQMWEHLGLVAAMFDALGWGDVVDKATPQYPEKRDLTVGEAVTAMVRKGRGVVNPARALVPRGFQTKPPLASWRPACPPHRSMMRPAAVPWRRARPRA